MNRVILLAEAREDALEAFRWCEKERRGLGKVFRAALNDAIRRIRISPLASAVLYRDLPVDDIEAQQIADEVLRAPPAQGYLTISNALQWRLQYAHAIAVAGSVVGVSRLGG